MKLYTINATPYRPEFLQSVNDENLDKYPDTVARVLKANGVDGFTIYQVQGYWQGEPEASFKIEVATDDVSTVTRTCHDLRDMFDQDSVMLTLPNNTVKFI